MEQQNWTIYFHPAFSEVRDKLINKVIKLKKKFPDSYKQHETTKFLKKVDDLIFKEIPVDPSSKAYFQGTTLGSVNTHWRRAKFFERFRLFFRFCSKRQIIIYAWLNDDNTLRKAGSKNDPYYIFAKRLKSANPPSDWNDLFAESFLILNDKL